MSTNTRVGKDKEASIGGCCFVLFGMLFALIAISILIDQAVFRFGTVSANGTIVSCDVDEKGDYFVTIRLTTQKDQQITFQSSDNSSSCHDGEVVPVKYHPNDPQDARVDNGSAGGSEALTVLVWVGGLCMLIGLFDLILVFWKGRSIMRGPGHGIGR